MKRIMACALQITLLLALCSCAPTAGKAEHAVSDEIKEAFLTDTPEIRMADFTDFAWDTLIVYRDPVDIEEINALGGIDYRDSLDLLDGMIFVKDGQVVYEETFPTDFETPCEFRILPDPEGCQAPGHVRAFTPETAVFSGEKETYDERDQYTLYPAADRT